MHKGVELYNVPHGIKASKKLERYLTTPSIFLIFFGLNATIHIDAPVKRLAMVGIREEKVV